MIIRGFDLLPHGDRCFRGDEPHIQDADIFKVWLQKTRAPLLVIRNIADLILGKMLKYAADKDR